MVASMIAVMKIGDKIGGDESKDEYDPIFVATFYTYLVFDNDDDDADGNAHIANSDDNEDDEDNNILNQ